MVVRRDGNKSMLTLIETTSEFTHVIIFNYIQLHVYNMQLYQVFKVQFKITYPFL